MWILKKIDDLMKRCKPLIDGALTEEGCQDYSWTLDPYVPGRIWVMERWESEESLKKHFEDDYHPLVPLNDLSTTKGH